MTEIQELKSELQNIKNLLAAALGGLIPKQREVNTYDYLDEWLETCKKPFVCEKTYKDLFRNVNAHIKPNLPDKRLYEITADDLQKCLNAIPQARTRESIHTVLLNAFTRAHNLGYIPKNPGEGMIYRQDRRKGRQPLSVASNGNFGDKSRLAARIPKFVSILPIDGHAQVRAAAIHVVGRKARRKYPNAARHQDGNERNPPDTDI